MREGAICLDDRKSVNELGLGVTSTLDGLAGDNSSTPWSTKATSLHTRDLDPELQQNSEALDRWFSEEVDCPFLALPSSVGMAGELRDTSTLDMLETGVKMKSIRPVRTQLWILLPKN
jgi:hypothetical protein